MIQPAIRLLLPLLFPGTAVLGCNTPTLLGLLTGVDASECTGSLSNASQNFPGGKHLGALHDWHDASYPFEVTERTRPLGVSWQQNHDIVTNHGHEWCVLQRLGWSCVGDHYAKVLSNVKPYSGQAFQLDYFSTGTVIVAGACAIRAYVNPETFSARR